MEIKGIIMDVDGVIVGKQYGINYPLPNPMVLKALKEVKSRGVFISLCTGKAGFAISDIIELANLNNLHIADGGANIMNGKSHYIDSKAALALVKEYVNSGFYVELYTESDYFIQRSQKSEATEIHTKILKKSPVMVDSLLEFLKVRKVVKIMPILEKNDVEAARKLCEQFDEVNFSIGVHPSSPYKYGIITPSGISKESAAKEISKYQKVPFDNILGVGDGIMDWQFIKLCKYKAAMGNSSDELKNLVSSNEGFIAPSVEENGILDVFNHFGLL